MQGAPTEGSDERAGFLAEVEGLRAKLAMAAAYRPGRAVAAAHAAIRARAMDREGATTVQLVRDGVVLAAVKAQERFRVERMARVRACAHGRVRTARLDSAR